MASMGHQTAEQLAEDLATQLVPYCTQPVDLVLENDLAGRAILAACWPARHKLTVYLLTDVPEADSTQKLIAGLLDVTNPPVVHCMTADDVVRLITSEQQLIWAVLPDRTSPAARAVLQQRTVDTVVTPWSDTQLALDGDTPEPNLPGHERVLRDVIGYHAPFLNFFGDRHNPQDLYERTRYPAWFTPPPGFAGGLPQLHSQHGGAPCAESADIPSPTVFTGTLEIEEGAEGQSMVRVNFGPVLEAIGATCDVTVRLRPSAALDTKICVVRGARRVHKIPDPTGELAEVHCAAVKPGTVIRVIVTGSAGTLVEAHLAVHPLGTHRQPGIIQRMLYWFTDTKLAHTRKAGGR